MDLETSMNLRNQGKSIKHIKFGQFEHQVNLTNKPNASIESIHYCDGRGSCYVVIAFIDASQVVYKWGYKPAKRSYTRLKSVNALITFI